MRTVGLALATLAIGLPPETPAFATPIAPEAESGAPTPALLVVSSDASAHDGGGALTDSASLNGNATQRAPAATAFAAPLSASEDTYMRSHSVGLQAIGFGFSIASTREDVSCRRLHNARALDELGYRDAALQLLCFDKDVRRAMERAGTPCVQSARLLQSPPPPPADPAAEPPPMATYAVLFDFDNYHLRPEADEILAPLLASLQADPTLNVDIEGHTDWVGARTPTICVCPSCGPWRW
jgi:hypothetical protein